MTKFQTLGGAAAPPAPMSRTPMTMVTIFTLYLLVGTQILSCLDFLLTTYVRET